MAIPFGLTDITNSDRFKSLSPEDQQTVYLNYFRENGSQEVRKQAEAMGVDPDLAHAMMLNESGGDPRAVSPAGAVGLLQVMPSTGQEMGYDITDPPQNIAAGLKYLRKQLDTFGDMGRALIAYNAGPGRVDNPPLESLRYARLVQQSAANLKRVMQGEGGLPLPEYVSRIEKLVAQRTGRTPELQQAPMPGPATRAYEAMGGELVPLPAPGRMPEEPETAPEGPSTGGLALAGGTLAAAASGNLPALGAALLMSAVGSDKAREIMGAIGETLRGEEGKIWGEKIGAAAGSLLGIPYAAQGIYPRRAPAGVTLIPEEVLPPPYRPQRQAAAEPKLLPSPLREPALYRSAQEEAYPPYLPGEPAPQEIPQGITLEPPGLMGERMRQEMGWEPRPATAPVTGLRVGPLSPQRLRQMAEEERLQRRRPFSEVPIIGGTTTPTASLITLPEPPPPPTEPLDLSAIAPVSPETPIRAPETAPEPALPGPIPKEVIPAEPEAAPVAKEPWEMTRAEYVDRHVRSPGMHRYGVQQALARGDDVPPEVLADYPDLTPTESLAGIAPELPEIPAPPTIELPTPAAAAEAPTLPAPIRVRPRRQPPPIALTDRLALWVAKRGGLDMRGLPGESVRFKPGTKGVPVGVLNSRSQFTADQMAEEAHRAGYITEPTEAAFLAALRQDVEAAAQGNEARLVRSTVGQEKRIESLLAEPPPGAVPEPGLTEAAPQAPLSKFSSLVDAHEHALSLPESSPERTEILNAIDEAGQQPSSPALTLALEEQGPPARRIREEQLTLPGTPQREMPRTAIRRPEGAPIEETPLFGMEVRRAAEEEAKKQMELIADYPDLSPAGELSLAGIAPEPIPPPLPEEESLPAPAEKTEPAQVATPSLEALNHRIDDLEYRMGGTEGELRREYQDQLASLRERRNKLLQETPPPAAPAAPEVTGEALPPGVKSIEGVGGPTFDITDLTRSAQREMEGIKNAFLYVPEGTEKVIVEFPEYVSRASAQETIAEVAYRVEGPPSSARPTPQVSPEKMKILNDVADKVAAGASRQEIQRAMRGQRIWQRTREGRVEVGIHGNNTPIITR